MLAAGATEPRPLLPTGRVQIILDPGLIPSDKTIRISLENRVITDGILVWMEVLRSPTLSDLLYPVTTPACVVNQDWCGTGEYIVRVLRAPSPPASSQVNDSLTVSQRA